MEIPGGVLRRGTASGPWDWAEADRVAYYIASQQAAPISSGNSFFRASLYNTQNYRPDEYTTIWLRHVYYDWVSYLLMYPMNSTWNDVKDIRFFDAVNVTTSVWGISSASALAAGYVVPHLPGAPNLSAASLKIITDVNKLLFRENMVVIKMLFFDVKYPFVIPQACFITLKSPPKLKAMEFDLQMVEFEQRLVAFYINSNQAAFTSSVIGEVDALLSYTPPIVANFLQRFGLPWAKKYLKVSALTFMDIKHREAIGKAMVFFFHRLSYSDYEKYMNTP